MSLACSILLHDWRRFVPALLSVAFAGVLMLVQLGLLLGMFGSVTVLVDTASADLWITSPETQSFEQSRDIPARLAALAGLHPQVIHTETMQLHDADWRSGTATRVAVSLVGLRPEGRSIACPEVLRAALCARLSAPMSVLVDRGDLAKLGIEPGIALGQLAEVNGRRVRVVGVTSGLRSIGSAYVFASEQTERALAAHAADADTDADDPVSFVLVQLLAGADAGSVRDQLQSLMRRPVYRVWTAAEFSMQSQRYWLLESGVGAGFLFSSMLGLVIGIVITSQTLRGVILGSLREYATFRAIGVPARRLSAVILEQSLWIGLCGALATLVLSAVASLLARSFYIPLTLTPWAIVSAALLSIATAVMSGLLALRELYRLEPVELLR
ncbi:MAG: transporter permease [Hydrocarboniphaga sp.]|uniref:ABC transporter permease n=1 Tax=Hydrocarboniphaga sp. TaxID=2033016 RepID=UPI00260D8C1D|nr:ABC transporter permease [Hydrocarboniphaga sp.]MDB5972575.1 transporter permease [Hydrocarboniphaga sp.]